MSVCVPLDLTFTCLDDTWVEGALTPDQQDAKDRAEAWFRQATGGVWGPCEITTTHCPPTPAGTCAPLVCACPSACRFDLQWPASGPVVVIQGEYTIPTQSFIDSYTTLHIVEGCPPSCAPVDITYTRGFPVTANTRASLAFTELVLALYNNPCFLESCTLPSGTTQVVRAGITMTIDPNETPLTPLRGLNDFIASIQYPTGPRVYTLDDPPGIQKSWTNL